MTNCKWCHQTKEEGISNGCTSMCDQPNQWDKETLLSEFYISLNGHVEANRYMKELYEENTALKEELLALKKGLT